MMTVTEPTEFLWFHFSGGSAAYIRLLLAAPASAARS